jgi:hypothetical protein
MMAGYELVDKLVGNLKLFLEMNAVVLWGRDERELFIEGDHRSGALVMSYILAREGRPPFVLTAGNAKAYLDPSTLITETRKHSLVALFRLPKIKRYFTKFLKEYADRKYLLSSAKTLSREDMRSKEVVC